MNAIIDKNALTKIVNSALSTREEQLKMERLQKMQEPASKSKKMIEEEGWDGATDDYYVELDNRIRKEFPHKFNQEGGATRNSPAVASATRRATKGKKSVKLSSSQVAIAKKLGVSLEDYAKQVARLNP